VYWAQWAGVAYTRLKLYEDNYIIIKLIEYQIKYISIGYTLCADYEYMDKN